MKNHIKMSILFVFFVIIDQATKYLAKTSLSGKSDFSVLPNIFSFHYLENAGAAFGLLQNKTIFFVIITIVIIGVIIYFYLKIPKEKKYNLLRFTCALLAAGAIGNFIDRIIYTHVIDFLYFELINFPVFNIADCYVTCSAVLLFYLLIFYYKEDELDFLKSKKNRVQ